MHCSYLSVESQATEHTCERIRLWFTARQTALAAVKEHPILVSDKKKTEVLPRRRFNTPAPMDVRKKRKLDETLRVANTDHGEPQQHSHAYWSETRNGTPAVVATVHDGVHHYV